MTEPVVRAAGNHSDARARNIEKSRRRRAPAAVMRDLEDIDSPDVRREIALRFVLDVAGEKNRSMTRLDAHHDGTVVLWGSAERMLCGECVDVELADIGDGVPRTDESHRRLALLDRLEHHLRALSSKPPRIDP